jgi:acetoin utilization deacetylase AcuC-like enzyme
VTTVVQVLVLSDLGELDRHDTGEWHPERPPRLDAVRRGIADALGPGDDGIVRVGSRTATNEEIVRVHSSRYVWSLERLAAEGGGELDPDTPVSAGSWDTAVLAAGAGLAVVDELRSRGRGVGFVAVRPPGHHARPGIGMGFCLLNNVAITAAALADAGERVLIVDWDVHHGNGTQDIFWDDPRVLYVSMHQSPMYPGTGRVSETGGAGAAGTTINFPFPAGTTGEMYRRALDDVVADASAAFGPTWVLISAGYDAHRDDPLAGHALAAGDYAELASRVAALAPADGRVAVFLEGGYDLPALRRSVAATVGRLTGSFESDEGPTHGGPGDETIGAARTFRERLAGDG